jgi:hypothetical protein
MYRIVLLVPLIIGCFNSTGSRSSLKIIAGGNAKEGQFPETVLLLSKTGLSCTGVVVGNNTVVTAMHCLIGQLQGKRIYTTRFRIT